MATAAGSASRIGHVLPRRRGRGPVAVRLERVVEHEDRPRVGLQGGEFHRERRALAEAAPDGDRSAVRLDDRSNDREPEPEPTRMPAASRIGSREALEDPVEILLRDPRARNAEGDEPRGAAATDADLDG